MPIDHTHSIISVRHVSFAYGVNEVLHDVSLDIHPGDYVGVIGPNGGGKTTLVKLMVGLLAGYSGSITLFGEPISRFSDWKKIGYIAQRVTSFDQKFPITVREVVEMGQISGPRDNTIVDWALTQVNLTQESHALIGNLSGGQQQRAFIARALAQKPEIIFLDEPTAGVDAQAQRQFYRLLTKMNQELGITLVLVSHDIDVVTSEVTEVACINRGLVYHGNSEDFHGEQLVDRLYGKGVKLLVHEHTHA